MCNECGCIIVIYQTHQNHLVRFLDTLGTGTRTLHFSSVCPYNTKVINATPLSWWLTTTWSALLLLGRTLPPTKIVPGICATHSLKSTVMLRFAAMVSSLETTPTGSDPCATIDKSTTWLSWSPTPFKINKSAAPFKHLSKTCHFVFWGALPMKYDVKS